MICMAEGGRKKELLNKLLDTMSRGGKKTEQFIFLSALYPV